MSTVNQHKSDNVDDVSILASYQVAQIKHAHTLEEISSLLSIQYLDICRKPPFSSTKINSAYSRIVSPINNIIDAARYVVKDSGLDFILVENIYSKFDSMAELEKVYAASKNIKLKDIIMPLSDIENMRIVVEENREHILSYRQVLLDLIKVNKKLLSNYKTT